MYSLEVKSINAISVPALIRLHMNVMIVERVKKIVEYTNNTELSSFELELRIVDGVKK